MNKNYFKRCAVCVMAAAQLMLASCGGPAAEVSGKNPSSALQSGEVSAAESGYTTTSDASSQGGSSVISSNVSSALLSGSSSAGSSASSSKTSSLTSSATSSKTSSTASQASAWDLKPVLVSQVDSKTVKVNDTTYKLTFSDEFNGTSLDTSKWDYCPNYQRGDLNPKNRWDDSMVSVKDGNLVLSVDIKDGVPVSGAVRTYKKNYSKILFSQRKGYFEARIKLQSAPGFWSAFWLMDSKMTDNAGNGARDGAEIDIMEAFSVANGIINHAIHWDGYGSNHKSIGHEVNEKSIYDGKYHTFSLEWTDTEYIFYIDGKRTYRTSDPGMCENALYLKLTAECGTWAGTLNTSKLPDAFYVDYVRVYQKA